VCACFGSAVDFGAGWYALDDAFGRQRAKNLAGMSPPYCSEF
jgi:beta-galactosidase